MYRELDVGIRHFLNRSLRGAGGRHAARSSAHLKASVWSRLVAACVHRDLLETFILFSSVWLGSHFTVFFAAEHLDVFTASVMGALAGFCLAGPLRAMSPTYGLRQLREDQRLDLPPVLTGLSLAAIGLVTALRFHGISFGLLAALLFASAGAALLVVEYRLFAARRRERVLREVLEILVPWEPRPLFEGDLTEIGKYLEAVDDLCARAAESLRRLELPQLPAPGKGETSEASRQRLVDYAEALSSGRSSFEDILAEIFNVGETAAKLWLICQARRTIGVQLDAAGESLETIESTLSPPGTTSQLPSDLRDEISDQCQHVDGVITRFKDSLPKIFCCSDQGSLRWESAVRDSKALGEEASNVVADSLAQLENATAESKELVSCLEELKASLAALNGALESLEPLEYLDLSGLVGPTLKATKELRTLYDRNTDLATVSWKVLGHTGTRVAASGFGGYVGLSLAGSLAGAFAGAFFVGVLAGKIFRYFEESALRSARDERHCAKAELEATVEAAMLAIVQLIHRVTRKANTELQANLESLPSQTPVSRESWRRRVLELRDRVKSSCELRMDEISDNVARARDLVRNEPSWYEVMGLSIRGVADRKIDDYAKSSNSSVEYELQRLPSRDRCRSEPVAAMTRLAATQMPSEAERACFADLVSDIESDIDSHLSRLLGSMRNAVNLLQLSRREIEQKIATGRERHLKEVQKAQAKLEQAVEEERRQLRRLGRSVQKKAPC